MTIQTLTRSMLAAMIGAALALGTVASGEANAAPGRAAQDDGTASKGKAGQDEREERKQARLAVQANERAAVAATADRNAVRANVQANERARIAANVQREQEQRNDRARAGARADADFRAAALARQQAQARAEAQAHARDRRDFADRNDTRVSPRPNDRAIERSPVHSTVSPQAGVPYGQLVSEQRHRRNEERQAEHRDRNDRRDDRRDDRRVAIERERDRANRYNSYLAERQRLARIRALDLQRANRLSQYRYQQEYYQRLRQMQLRDSRYDWYRDPYFNTAPSYGYYRAGNYYQVNRYAADMLRDAVRMGYQEGVRAGRADAMDGWRPNYRDSFAYQDANYGYRGYYVDREEYNYYFREGFRRGYEDGYQRNNRYGRYDNGNISILETVLSVILNMRNL
jgi:hypothetical protein